MTVDPSDSLTALRSRLRDFATARNWEQFHNPKDLAVSVAIEASELLEVFQWKNNDDVYGLLSTQPGRASLADELADVLIYLVRLADVAGIDLGRAAVDKVDRNETRFPPSAG